jgi:hypothetical protein
VLKNPYLAITLKHENSDGGNFDMPNRSHKALPLSGMVKVLDLTRRKLYTEIAKISSKNDSSIH